MLNTAMWSLSLWLASARLLKVGGHPLEVLLQRPAGAMLFEQPVVVLDLNPFAMFRDRPHYLVWLAGDNYPGRRIDSSELLPVLTCCLT